ncbi:putative phosphatase [Fulvia fulva]|uniref:Phosphatase n=1 Tax=Passalora fulva TaxID=5499 RepID=A0A9Q8L7Q8_PASFU|nr:putative phosphatase [Fulvia fulva]KAK4634347.1 putative phosphatase [Fulvia fulva]KAK4638203.1 putative phosphatase [Fulvia fulva]UJO12342.1 putative phosphatase [Fulvia fulva]WPV10114.1 putative phosphatase [Fulvia fulva]WPV25260.1 putative phosphatase [Fulvia fulva]
MPPTVHCIRHAQGYHNLNAANHNMHDPLLTVLGHEQCKTLGRDFPYSSNVDLIVASPIKRTIYTALEAFEEIIRKKGLKVVALPEVQETSDLPCDTGSDRAELEREFEGRPIDLDLVHEGWNNKRGKWAPTAAAIQNRAREGRVWLMNRPEKEIVIVTHGGFLHYFTEDWSDTARFVGTGWNNTEYRSYTFSSHQPEEAHLIETPESLIRRKQAEETNKDLSKEEDVNLKRTVSNT